MSTKPIIPLYMMHEITYLYDIRFIFHTLTVWEPVVSFSTQVTFQSTVT